MAGAVAPVGLALAAVMVALPVAGKTALTTPELAELVAVAPLTVKKLLVTPVKV